MVLLKSDTAFEKVNNTTSTFHYGSIKIIILLTFLLGVSVSTFHYGSIKIMILPLVTRTSYKSTFHYGSIKIFDIR